MYADLLILEIKWLYMLVYAGQLIMAIPTCMYAGQFMLSKFGPIYFIFYTRHQTYMHIYTKIYMYT